MLCFCCFPCFCFRFTVGSLNFSQEYQLEGRQLVVISANQTFVDQKGLLHAHMKTRALLLFLPHLGSLGRSQFSHYVGPPGYILFRDLSIIILFFLLAGSKSCAILCSLLLLFLHSILKVSMGLLAR